MGAVYLIFIQNNPGAWVLSLNEFTNSGNKLRYTRKANYRTSQLSFSFWSTHSFCSVYLELPLPSPRVWTSVSSCDPTGGCLVGWVGPRSCILGIRPHRRAGMSFFLTPLASRVWRSLLHVASDEEHGIPREAWNHLPGTELCPGNRCRVSVSWDPISHLPFLTLSRGSLSLLYFPSDSFSWYMISTSFNWVRIL